jgi:hypothetical protein
MSEWITDRLPTKEDGVSGNVICCRWGHINLLQWYKIEAGEPWQPIPRPAPYVKPKRWTVKYDIAVERWMLLRDGGRRWVLPFLSVLGGEAAQRIADVYNEVEP